MLEACPISDALITWIPADKDLRCGNSALYAVIIYCLALREAANGAVSILNDVMVLYARRVFWEINALFEVIP